MEDLNLEELRKLDKELAQKCKNCEWGITYCDSCARAIERRNVARALSEVNDGK